MTLTEIESKIRSIALRSYKFKIGQATITHYSEKIIYKWYGREEPIKIICWSRKKEKIDKIETKIKKVFSNWKSYETGNSLGNEDKNVKKYMLYVISVLKEERTNK